MTTLGIIIALVSALTLCRAIIRDPFQLGIDAVIFLIGVCLGLGFIVWGWL